jgi:alpha-glucosidase (family GH31 glycosyl hydrolase)
VGVFVNSNSYTPAIEDTVRSYLNIRYKLAPSLIAAGHLTAESGFPFVTRGDLFW